MENSHLRREYLLKLGFVPPPLESGPAPPVPDESCAVGAVCTLLLLDWDDTLFCTTHAQSGTVPQEDLQDLTAQAVGLLTEAHELGQTIIVTNAATGWVETCVRRHMPGAEAAVRRSGVTSARSRFERRYPGDPVAWKCAAFAELKENSRCIANLVAVGDQEPEMRAVRELAALYRTAYVKTVRFKRRPSARELATQLSLLRQKLPAIVSRQTNMNIVMKRTRRTTPPPQAAAPTGDYT